MKSFVIDISSLLEVRTCLVSAISIHSTPIVALNFKLYLVDKVHSKSTAAQITTKMCATFAGHNEAIC